MAESTGRPGSHGAGGRNSNNNGRGNQGPGGGGGGNGDTGGAGSNRSVATRGLNTKAAPTKTKEKAKARSNTREMSWEEGGIEEDEETGKPDFSSKQPEAPSPNPEGEGGLVGIPDITQDPTYDPSLDYRQNVERYQRSRGYGRYSGREKDYGRKVPDHVLEGLTEEEKQATAESISPSRSFGSAFGNKLSGVFGQSMSRAGLTINGAGELAYDENTSPTGFALDRALEGVPGGGLISGAIGLSREFGGPAVPGSISHVTSVEKVDQRADSNRDRSARAGALSGLQGDKNLSLTDRAQQTLYPTAPIDEEDKPRLGLGLSLGASPIKKAPSLSFLNLLRPQYKRRA